MSTFPWLTVIGAVPLVGALAIAAAPASSAPGSAADRSARRLLVKQLALVFSLITLGLTIAMMVAFKSNGPEFQFTQTYQWIPQFGVHYAVGVDGIALVLIAMTAVLMPVVVLASWNDADPPEPADGAVAPAADSTVAARPRRGVKSYFALLLVLETMMIGVFAATDVFLFYVLFEAMLIPMYFLIGSFGVGQRQYAAVKFLLYSLFGGLLMLVAVIALYVYSAHGGHPGTFLFSQLTHVTFSPVTQKWLFLGFFVAFAIKAPLWPFHTWLPDAATAAQPGTAVLLVGVMDKVGTFGMIRYCLQLFPAASRYFTPLILVLSVIGILYGAIVAIGQRDLKRLIAYTSVSHFGFIVLGIFVLTSQGQSGATLYMVNHAFATGALFLIAGFMIARRRSQRIADYGGVQQVAPLLAGLFLVAGLAVAVAARAVHVRQRVPRPGRHVHPVQGGRVVRHRGHHPGRDLHPVDVPAHDDRAGAPRKSPTMPDLRPRELWAVGPLVALLIVFGVYPKPLLDLINPAVHDTLSQVHVTDPVPQHPTYHQLPGW